MISQERRETRIMLELDQYEAWWLRSIMQNPTEDDSGEDREMRKRFFDELSKWAPELGMGTRAPNRDKENFFTKGER